MAKYFIHNGEQDSIINELPAEYTVLEITSAERSAVIDPLPLDVVGAPCIIEELELYTAWNIDTKSDSWQCIHVPDATTWAEFEAKRTHFITMNEQQHNELKTLIESS